MERHDLIPQKGNFYKANLHCHTVVSDGTLTVEETKKVYMEHGYSIVAFTDHCRYINHKELNAEDFLAIAAYEVDLTQTDNKPWPLLKTYHINLFDTLPDEHVEEKEKSPLPERNYNPEYINQYIEKMKELGFAACYNHPYWSMQDYRDYSELKGFFAMEIYNHGCEHDGLYGYHPQVYDEMLRTGQRLFCLATDDNHNREPFSSPLCDSFGGFTMIKAEDLSYKNVIKALLKGDFYASMGPEIKELYIENGKLVIRCSPVEKIFVQTAGRDCHKKLALPGETITEAVFELSGKEGYIRIDCRDARGLHANSNAYFLEP